MRRSGEARSLRVVFSDTCRLVAVDRKRLRSVLRRILTDHGCDAGTVSVAIVDDAAIRDLNRRFLQHDEPTDVLSFSLGDGEGSAGSEDALGEIVISAETALRQAPSYRTTPERELARYAIHGALHLVGYDDGTPGEKRQMRRRERKYLALLEAV